MDWCKSVMHELNISAKDRSTWKDISKRDGWLNERTNERVVHRYTGTLESKSVSMRAYGLMEHRCIGVWKYRQVYFRR